MTRSSLALSTALTSALLATPALAQVDAFGLDEVIVTAQKRTENLQEVPISVATIDGEQFQALQTGGGDILQVAARIPGVYAESSNGRLAPRFYIRGLGNVDFDLAASQPVSIIIDDVVQENVVLKSNPIFDTEQVEVLRGPQGTLFGRNTPAGIIKFDSRRPTDFYTGNVNASWGSFNTVVVDGGVGGPIVDGLSFRASGLYRQRDDYVDNVIAGTPDDDLGELEEYAGRLQILAEPTDALSVLLNGHYRDLEGTAAIFRANIIERGTNDIIDTFEREQVFFDGGEDNEQEGETYGFSAKVEYDFGNVTFTSISGYEAGDTTGIADIDGGFIGPNSFFDPAAAPDPLTPDTIAFPAVTRDSLEDLEQFTQEIRLASNTSGPLNWQVGAYYFDTSFDIRTIGPAFPPETLVSHGNEAFAVFGQVGYDITDRLTVTAGLRYTDEERTFEAPMPPPTVTVDPTEVNDDEITGDISLLYAINENLNVYGRYARGYRGPTIQGRDVAFAAFSGATNPQSVAESETIDSFEAGFKSEFLDNRVRLNATAFYYEVDDQQFSIIGGVNNTNTVINADQGRAYGFEADLDFLVTENFFVQAGVGYVDTEIQDDDLATATCGSGLCTVTDPLNPANLSQALIDGNQFPNAPALTVNAFAEYTVQADDGGELFANADLAVQGETDFFLYTSEEFSVDSQFEIGAAIGYRAPDDRYSVSLFARNITDEENLRGGIDFNNLTGFLNDPRVFGAAISAGF